MKTLKLSKASRTLADYATKLGAPGIVITSKKKPVAALVPIKDVDRETLSLSMSPAFMRIIRRAREEVNKGKVLPLEQLKEDVLVDIAAPNKALRRSRRRAARR
jgi:PHD/YefM family antitoxin component YafN of YafNO toxin-antitoxin module